MKKTVDFEEHDILENPSPSVEYCFKDNEEMVFDVMATREHCWCDEIKRGIAFNGDDSTYVKPGAFSLNVC